MRSEFSTNVIGWGLVCFIMGAFIMFVADSPEVGLVVQALGGVLIVLGYASSLGEENDLGAVRDDH